MHAHPGPADTFALRPGLRTALLCLCCWSGVAGGQEPDTAPQPETVVPAGPESATPAQPGMQPPPLPAATEPEAVPEARPPGRVIEDLHGALIEVMQRSAELGYHGRYQRMEPVVTSSFDTPLIVKVILSRYWDELDSGQQQQFIDLFRRLSIATYASRFHDYDGEQFVEIGREELKRERLLIKTELRRPSQKAVRLDYLMHKDASGHWLIISVIANGVNDLSLKRAEYAAVIREKGYEGLLADIQQKITEMESGVGS